MSECSICLEPLDLSSPRVGVCKPCAHVFHGECLVNHLKHTYQEFKCPLCRVKIDEYRGFDPTTTNYKRYQQPERYQHNVVNNCSIITIPRDGEADYILSICHPSKPERLEPLARPARSERLGSLAWSRRSVRSVRSGSPRSVSRRLSGWSCVIS